MKKGFTLIELMVAITIIALLATIGLAAYNQTRAAARDSKRIGDIQEIQKALEQYYATTGSYPPNITDTGAGKIGSFFQNGTAPLDPINNGNGNYIYVYNYCSPKYNLCAKLENCGSKCNVSWNNAASNPDCTVTLGQAGAGNNYYCVGSLSQ